MQLRRAVFGASLGRTLVRVIALPRERVEIVDGEVVIVGDNRSMAPRHHTFGAVPRARIRARLMF